MHFLRDRFVNLPDRDLCQLTGICAVLAQEPPDMAAFAMNGYWREALLAQISGEVLDEMLMLGYGGRLQSRHEPQPPLGDADEMLSGFLGVLQLVMTRFSVRPIGAPLSQCLVAGSRPPPADSSDR